MPFTSRAQQRFMFSQQPKIAKRWAGETKDIKDLPEHKGDKKMGKLKAYAIKKLSSKDGAK